MFSRQYFSDNSDPLGPPTALIIGGARDRAERGEVHKVLVVDDEPDTANLASMLLKVNGFEVVTVYSGLDALGALEANQEIDAVFSDIMMPGMTGLQLLKLIKARFRGVKVVLASGYTFGYASAGHEAPDLFVAKPYDMDDVISLLRR